MSREATERYIDMLASKPVDSLISNVSTDFSYVENSKIKIAYTINNTEWESCYVCSPYNALFTYGLEEINKLKNLVLEVPLKALTLAIGFIAKCFKINKNLHFNNLLLSTNLYPNEFKSHVKFLTNFGLKKYPNHAILFRSLNGYNSHEIIDALKVIGYKLVPSRVVYFFDCRKDDFLKKKDTKNDLVLLKKSKYKLVDNDDITDNDYSRIVDLYNLLYLDKYSVHNPHFTKEFISNCHKDNFLYFKGFRDPETQELVAILGFYEVDKVMTTPVFGYDTTKDSSEGLYRLITIALLLEGKKRNCLIHSSSGAGKFKRLRGAAAYNEYTAIYYKHLPFYRRVFWYSIEKLLVNLALPIIRKYEL